MSTEVFVSYSSQDRNRVIPVVEYLRNSGISVWVDEGNIHAADLWSEQIVQAIAGCQVMVVMLSGNSTDSHNVVKEAMLASEQKKALLPVYLEPAEIPAKLQYQLAGIQHLELYGQDEQQVLEDLANSLVKRGVNREGETAVPQSTTVKRHERPKVTPQSIGQSKNLAKSIAWALAVCVVVLLGLLLLKSQSNVTVQSVEPKQEAAPSRMHVNIPIPEEYPMAKPTDMPFGVMRRILAISPDGNHLVYVCTVENELYLCLRNLGDDTFKLLKESKGGILPFFSPDSKWVGFVTADKIKKIELSSGLLKNICDANNPFNGATWGSDGMIYFGDSEGASFLKVSENGGEASVLTDKILRVLNPNVTPDGSGVLFRAAGVNVFRGAFSVYYIDPDSGEITRLGDGVMPDMVNRNDLVTIEDGNLRITEIDMKSLKPVGSPRTISKSKILYRKKYGAQYSISDNDILVFLKGVSSSEFQLTVLNPTANESKPLIEKHEMFGQYSVSPDGKKVAVEVYNNQISEINILNVNRSRLNTFVNSGHNYTPMWSPDGKKLYYSSNRTDPTLFELYEYDFSQRREKKIDLGVSSMGVFNISDISDDGEKLLCFGTEHGAGLNELYLVDIRQEEKTRLTDNEVTEWGAVFSSDEKWIAYTSEKDMEGSYAIYLNRFPEMNKETRISAGGGEEPKWLPDGSAVYYRNGSKWLKVVLDLKGESEAGEPELFFEGDYVNVWGPSHDIFPDGRILLLKGEEWMPPTEIDVIINALDLAL
tara:strand:- start:218 stop:2509 length:2292 start_codon:yes stop_codon:yes gene_type:complete